MIVEHLQAVVNSPPLREISALASVPIGKHFKITATGLEVIGDPPFQVWSDLGEMLRTFEKSIQFVIGDYARQLEHRFGEQASQILDATGWSSSTLRAYIWASEKIPVENRMIDRGLSFKHHLVVAALPAKTQKVWLERALGTDGDHWTVNRLTAALKEGSDLPVIGWSLHATCSSAKQREKIVKLIELEGATVKIIDRRKPKTDAL